MKIVKVHIKELLKCPPSSISKNAEKELVKLGASSITKNKLNTQNWHPPSKKFI